MKQRNKDSGQDTEKKEGKSCSILSSYSSIITDFVFCSDQYRQPADRIWKAAAGTVCGV